MGDQCTGDQCMRRLCREVTPVLSGLQGSLRRLHSRPVRPAPPSVRRLPDHRRLGTHPARDLHLAPALLYAVLETCRCGRTERCGLPLSFCSVMMKHSIEVGVPDSEEGGPLSYRFDSASVFCNNIPTLPSHFGFCLLFGCFCLMQTRVGWLAG